MKPRSNKLLVAVMLTGVVPSPCIAADHDITRYGAVAGSTAPCEAAIQKAVDTAAAEGGRVLVPAGRFVSGPIRLKAKLEFHLAEGCVLAMSDDPAKFPASGNYRPAFLSAENCENIRVTGKGVIDGQGARWWKAFLDEKKAGTKNAPRRPQLIAFKNCRKVAVEDITTLNPPNTHYSFKHCADLTIRGIKAEAPDESPNTDALNLSNVHDVLIENCSISTGDDNIVLLCSPVKNPTRPGVENVVIRNCKLGFGHGLSIGSYTGGGVRNVLAENIRFEHTTSGIRMKAGRDRGGVVGNLRYRNITMRDVRYPIHITSYYPKPPAHPSMDPPAESPGSNPVWQDVVIEDVKASDCRNSISLWGLPDEPIRNVTFRNVVIAAKAGARIYHAEGISFVQSSILPETGPALRVFAAKVDGMPAVEETEKKIRFE